MKFHRLILFFVLFGLLSPVFAQKQNAPKRWEEKSYQMSRLIVHYFREEKMDSVQLFLKYWEQECGVSEPSMRFKILFAIQNGTFSEDIYDDQVLGYLMKYKARVDQSQKIGEEAWMMKHSTSQGYPNKMPFVTDAFNKLTMNLAIQAKNNFKPGDPAFFFAQFYNRDFDDAIRSIKSRRYAGTKIQSYARSYFNRAQNRLEEHLGIFAGLWQPQGELSTLGSHPAFGVVVGLKKNRVLVDIAGELRVGSAAESYVVDTPEGVKTTEEYFGGYAGLELGFELYQKKHHEFDLLCGVGYEGFDAVTGAGEEGNKSLSSSSLSVGLGYRFHLQKFSRKYIGAQVRYQILNYDNEGGSDLSGNAIQLRLMLGLAGNNRKNDILKDFK